MFSSRLGLRSACSRAALFSALAASGCEYDLAPIYEHDLVDAATMGQTDSGGAVDTAVMPVSSQLIGLWTNYPGVDRDCVECAETKCGTLDAECRADPDCLAYTKCVASVPTPQQQAACRGQYSNWVSADKVRDRDLDGPYGQCVFRDNCQVECEGSNDLSCVSAYSWPTTSDPSIPFRLILTDAREMNLTLKNVKVKVCPAGDVTCTASMGEGTTNERGIVDLMLPTGFTRNFTGYFELTGMGLYPTLLKFGWNPATPTTQLVSVVNESLFQAALGLIDIRQDPARGMLQQRMLGCNGVGVRGVQFTAEKADAQTKTWYINPDGVPSLMITSTNPVGSGGMINLSVGYTQTAAIRESDKVKVGETFAPVRAGFMTVVVFAPLAN